MELTDAHLHPSEPPERYADYSDLKALVLCTSRPGEWDAVKTPRASMSYGVHPWYADEWGPEAEKRLELILESDAEAHVGEIGLDSKRGTLDGQTAAFERQLSMASEHGRVVTIHDIGCEKRVLDAVRTLGKDCRSMILHSFSSESYSKPFSELGCYLSIGPRILSRSEVRLSRLLRSIPRDLLLLESDSPFLPPGFEGMGPFTERIAGILETDPEELSETVASNLRRALHGRGPELAHRDPDRKGRSGAASRVVRRPMRVRSRRRIRLRGAGPRRRGQDTRGRPRRLLGKQPEQAGPGHSGHHRDEEDRGGPPPRAQHQPRRGRGDDGRPGVRGDRAGDPGRRVRRPDRRHRHREDEGVPP